MGKAIIIHDISFASNNLGLVTFINNISSETFTITALEDVVISFTNNFEYNNKNYPELSQYSANSNLSLASGQRVKIQANIVPTENGIGTFTITGACKISGNILSLIGNNAISAHAFKELFKNCTDITDASELILPDTVAEGCYESMFYGCTSLTSSPVLPATTLVTNCYKELFYGCTSLNKITIYSESLLGTTYSTNWVYNVAATGTFIKKTISTFNETGVNSVPSGWDVEEFYNISYFTVESLVDNNTISIKNNNTNKLPTLYYSTDNTQTWSSITTVQNTTTSITTLNAGERILIKSTITNLATAYNNYNSVRGSGNFKVYGNAMSLLFGDDFIEHSEFSEGSSFNLCGLFYESTNLIDASNLILPALNCYLSCYNGMFRGATNLLHGPKILPGLLLYQDAYSSMFESCINLEEAPIIEATTFEGTAAMQRMFCMSRSTKLNTPKLTRGPVLKALVQGNNCYKEMFKGNGNLVEITNLSIERADGSTENWVSNCGNGTGIFYKNPNSPTWGVNDSGIPSGWTVKNYGEE